ncbi:unnamed protein product [Bursaphelenchus okinawaensis]|uniref:Uncharacterized protein n=1 Tax=Bursaphelenchus okinawaensis TaxID=465554 RepID=A0A811K5U7_9BILA|nr:unnamed protein product [Bursaphelenchus okinawaensis]CAG9092048.1 unnamed protein product [Bursaphelenchus okinawaensis]
MKLLVLLLLPAFVMSLGVHDRCLAGFATMSTILDKYIKNEELRHKCVRYFDDGLRRRCTRFDNCHNPCIMQALMCIRYQYATERMVLVGSECCTKCSN